MARAVLLGSIAATAFFVSHVANAQTPSPSDPGSTAAIPQNGTSSRITTYDAAYFTPFAPRTALDIARRVPGFQLDLGSTQTDLGQVDVRGFAGTAGNVVFNGARPTSKAETLEAILARIPAQRVVRAEIGPGDLYGSDYSGKSQVLNIILSAESGIDGNVTAAADRRYTGYINTDISGSAVIRRGPSTFNISAGTGRNKQLEEGTDTIIDEANVQQTEFRRKHNSYFNRDPFIAGGWALERGSDNAYRLNARWQPSRFDLHQDNRVTTASGQRDDNLDQHFRNPLIELGGDATRPLAGGAIKFVGLATRRKRDDNETYLQRDGLIDQGGSVVGGFDQTIEAQRNETIGRVSWTRANLGGFSFEAGAEAALNTLDSTVELFAFDQNGDRVRINLPLDDATVKEKRGEVYVSVGKNLSPTIRIDGGVNYEFSNLKVRGDALADRTLKFIKPNLSIDWRQPNNGWHGRLSVRRTVAQLDFYDFISVAELSTDRVNAGNENLQPQRTWELRATAEHPFLGDGVIKLDVGYDLISMLQDRILIVDDQGNAFDAPGNIGTGKRSFAELTVDAPLNGLWNGLRAKFTGTIQRTRVDDPIDGDPRNFSGYFPTWEWRLEVRRDAGKFSYGFTVNDNERFTFYRTDEFDSNFNGGPYGTAFFEYRPSAKTAITFDVDNLFSTSGNRVRRLFDPNRAAPTGIFDETRERNRHRSFGLTLKQSFGGGGSSGVAKAD